MRRKFQEKKNYILLASFTSDIQEIKIDDIKNCQNVKKFTLLEKYIQYSHRRVISLLPCFDINQVSYYYTLHLQSLYTHMHAPTPFLSSQEDGRLMGIPKRIHRRRGVAPITT